MRGTRVGLVGLVMAMLVALAAVAGPVTFEWDWPTQLEDGTAIPQEFVSDLRGTVHLQRLGTANWIASGTTGSATNRLTVDVPVGTWQCAVTAQFGTNVATRSAMSSGLEQKVYGRLKTVGKVRVLVVTQ